VRRLVVAVTLAACLVAAGPAGAAPLDTSLETRLARSLRSPSLPPARTGALAIDISAGSVVYEHNATRPFRPASTEKLTVTLAALEELGPGFTIETEVLGAGKQVGRIFKGNLVLEGSGDPDLDTRDLDDLARAVRQRGIRRVSGRVLGDESYFDRRRTAPGWKSSYYKIECPPLSALVVDRARLDGRTSDEPALAAAIAFKRALERAGVRVGNASAKGEANETAPTLASVASPALRKLVRWMNTESDNFYAEMLLKVLGAAELGEGSTEAGAQVVRRVLAERGVPVGSVRIVDGSGLSARDRLTAHALSAILSAAWKNPAVAGAFRSSLAVAGVSGTLEDRMEKPPARGRVRAKTGTTNEASALAGYTGPRYIFALLMNGSPVSEIAARSAQDRFATLLAGQ
jgi:serine-type D-Ala-D-Ala carboxypeptidase/endopeptidase (penicillin-binding protein 4)